MGADEISNKTLPKGKGSGETRRWLRSASSPSAPEALEMRGRARLAPCAKRGMETSAGIWSWGASCICQNIGSAIRERDERRNMEQEGQGLTRSSILLNLQPGLFEASCSFLYRRSKFGVLLFLCKIMLLLSWVPQHTQRSFIPVGVVQALSGDRQQIMRYFYILDMTYVCAFKAFGAETRCIF